MQENQRREMEKQFEHGEYLVKVFQMLKQQSSLTLVDKKTSFNHTELRMLSEILSAKYEGKSLISTQLAKRLGITRSAISQIVNRLEEQGVVTRIPDDVDKKIAYVEISENVLERYGDDIEKCNDFIGTAVAEFGEEKFRNLHELFLEFTELLQRKIQERNA